MIPNKKNKVRKNGFKFYPIVETPYGYQIELKSHRSRVVPSTKKIENVLRVNAYPIRPSQKTNLNLNNLSDSEFLIEILRTYDEGSEISAIKLIRNKYGLGLKEAKDKLHFLLSQRS